jgi:hypothetical protein
MGSTISLKALCATSYEREFSSETMLRSGSYDRELSSETMLRSDKRQRMSPICVMEEVNPCNPATAALEAALALDAFDDEDLPFEFGSVDGSLFTLEDFTPCRSTVHTVHEVTCVMSRMTTTCE